jgi:hypothetical protein
MASKPGRRGKTKTPAGARLRSEFSELRAAALGGSSYVDTLLDPHGTTPQRVPDNIVATSAVFKSPLIVSLPYSGGWDTNPGRTVPIDEKDPIDGESVVAIFPGIEASIWTTRGGPGADLFGGPVSGVFEPALVTPRVNTFNTVEGDGWIHHALRHGVDGVIPRLNASDIPVYEFSIVSTGVDETTSINFLFQETNNKFVLSGVNGIVQVRYNDNTFENINFVILQPFQIIPIALTPPVLGFTVSLSVRIIDQAVTDNWLFSVAPSSEQPVFQAPAFGACIYSVLAVRDLSNLDQTTSERTTAVAGLCTYMGSDLRNGGVISAARLPMGTTPTLAPQGNLYAYLARLPLYAEDYALKAGIYAWWLPDDVQEYFFRPYRHAQSDDLATTSSLWFAMRRDNPEQEVRLDVVHHVEVLTRSVQYMSEVGPVNPSFVQLILLAKTLPAITENNLHKLLVDAWKKVKNLATNPTNWVKLLKTGVKFLEGI